MSLTYQEALEKMGNRDKRKLENNTYLEKRGDKIAVRLHQTDVVTLDAQGGYTLNSGGWRTVTTKDRINAYAPFCVTQKDRIWYVAEFLFNDGMRLYKRAGTAWLSTGANKVTPTREKEIKTLKKKLANYAAGYAQALIEGKVKAPSNGDCWHCLFRDKTGKTWGELSPSDHIHQHVKDRYYVPSLVVTAMERFGSSQVARWAIGEAFQGKAADGIYKTVIERDIKKTIYRYALRQCGLAA